jgi:acetolactate synthase-1/3 small subunit
MEKHHKHGLCIFVENEFGVIQRLTNLFSARGMSIETIHTTAVDTLENISQVSISLYESEKNIELIQKLLMRILIVHDVQRITTEDDSFYISQIFHTKPEFFNEVNKIVNQYNLSLFNFRQNNKIYCITGTEESITTANSKLNQIPSLILNKKYKVC